MPGWRAIVLVSLVPAALVAWLQASPRKPASEPSEFNFIRVEYRDLPFIRRGYSRGWWMQDWPEAEIHFNQGIRRLTRIHAGPEMHLPLTDDRIFDHPWLYATQVGFWDLSDPEVLRLRDYLLRGGFLVVDDFHGDQDWEIFRRTMQRVLPDRPILDIDDADPLMNVVYNIRERTFIPGLRHLRIGPGGNTSVFPQGGPPHWRAMHDERGRMVVAINYNMDVGDAWEHADLPQYPEAMTTLAYRFGINYIVYSMTH